MKVYDCFSYYDEDFLLGLRFEILWDYVDYFVIVEGLYKFTGDYKGLNFDIQKFEKYKSKIRYFVHDVLPLIGDPWGTEEAQKNSVVRGLFDAEDGDLVIFSDVDEIINPSAIGKYNKFNLYACFDQLMFNYFLNIMVCDRPHVPRPWQFAKITTFKHLRDFWKTPFLLRNIKKDRGLSGRFVNLHRKVRRQVIPDGGWHFSWVMSPDRISEKMGALSHVDMNTSDYNNIDHIKWAVLNKKDIWGRDRDLVVVPVSGRYLPDYIIANKDLFRDYLADPNFEKISK